MAEIVADIGQLMPNTVSWALFFFCAILIGISKTGVQNVGTLTVPLFALLFGAKYSTGIVLIMLCIADLVAVVYYRNQLIWAEVLRLLPASLIGLVTGVLLGDYLDEKSFKMLMASCILFGMGVMFLGGSLRGASLLRLTENRWYSPIFGFIVGFSTMIGNAAGPALSIYLLTKKMDRFAFVATGAWFIMILNYTKIPLQVFVWDNLDWIGVSLSLLSVPFILLGGWIGIKVLQNVNETVFRKIVTLLVFVSCFILLLF